MNTDRELEQTYGRGFDESRLTACSLDLVDVVILLRGIDAELLTDQEVRQLGRALASLNRQVADLAPLIRERAQALRELRHQLDHWEEQ